MLRCFFKKIISINAFFSVLDTALNFQNNPCKCQIASLIFNKINLRSRGFYGHIEYTAKQNLLKYNINIIKLKSLRNIEKQKIFLNAIWLPHYQFRSVARDRLIHPKLFTAFLHFLAKVSGSLLTIIIKYIRFYGLITKSTKLFSIKILIASLVTNSFNKAFLIQT